METSCLICFQEYNLSTRLPRITLVCGHSFCSACLSRIIKNTNTSRCPLDKSPLPPGSDLERFPVNFALKGILEARPHADCCPEHGDELISFCLTDKRRICAICLEEDHRGHQTRAFKSIKSQTANYRKQMADLSQNMKATHDMVDDMLDKDTDVLLEKIEEDYNALVQVLTYKKHYLKAQTKFMFSQEKSRVKDLLGVNSTLSQDISKKDLDLQNILKQEEVIQLEEVPHIIESFQNQYQTIISSDLQPGKMGEECRQIIGSFCLQPNLVLDQGEKLKSGHLLTLLKVETQFSFEFENDSLIVQNDNEKPQEVELDMHEVTQVKNVTFILSQIVSSKDLELLTFIWGSFKGLIGLELQFKYILEEELSDIFCSNCHRLESIEINITGYVIDQQSIMISFLRDILRAAKNIQIIRLEMGNIVAANGVLEKIFKDGIFDTSDLREFHLNLNGTETQEKDIKPIFVQMPKLEALSLSLHGPKITDGTLICCAHNTLASAELLQTVSLDLENTNVTDIATEFLCQYLNSKNIFALMLNFRGTRITDRTAEMLSQRMLYLDLFENLEVLFLVFSNTMISDDGIMQLFKPVPKVRDFYLMLHETRITDKSINHLIETSLTSQENPETYMLYLGNTEITDTCFNKLLKSIKDAKSIILGFENTAISDETLEDFVDEKLATESVCQDLKINTQGSQISERLQEKITQINGKTLQKNQKTLQKMNSINRGFTRMDSKFFNF